MHKSTVLIIEDNEINREILEAILEDDYNLLIAENGKQGMELLSAHTADIDVVLLDIQMPVMNGYDLSRNVRSLDDRVKSNIPILALTANAFEEDRQLALAAQMNGHLSKPIDVEEMLRTIKSIL